MYWLQDFLIKTENAKDFTYPIASIEFFRGSI